MQISLPREVTTFFAISNGGDLRELDQCFAEGGVVHDERHTHEGLESIRKWLTHSQQQYHYTTQPVAATYDDPELRVRARVSGSFPGSPIELEYAFLLSNGRIARLEIQP